MTAVLREMDGATEGHGLVIYRASRLEDLLEAMGPLLEATRPDNVLEPQVIIAAHPGMRRWLIDELARRSGPQGVAANLDILLPSAWIDRLAERCLGQHAIDLLRYRQRTLRWQIHGLLAQGPDTLQGLGITDPRIASYLQDDGGGAADVAQRRFQLADRLAGLFTRYMVYRPDWLLAWELDKGRSDSGIATSPAEARQLHAPLWRALQKGHEAHRGSLVARLRERLAEPGWRPSAPLEPLHVFGVSHMAPAELELLRAYARQALVALFVPDPCREYWGLGSSLDGVRHERLLEIERIEDAGEGDYWVEQGHPLLASWGRLGQHFIMSLLDDEGDVLLDVRHHHDEQEVRPGNRLQRVQQSIRALDVALLAERLDDPTQCQDASLRVHACTTRLRELEVLRDQILAAMAQAEASGAPLAPEDIVVMAPSIQAYGPLIPAVFGNPGDEEHDWDGAIPQVNQRPGRRVARPFPAWRHTPYDITDATLAASHPLPGAFGRFLTLTGSRLTAAELADLLAEPHVALRLGLDESAADELVGWLRNSGAAWALDEGFRARFGVPPIREHTFAWAMDRLLAGYVMADAAADEHQAPFTLPDGAELLPMGGIQFPAAAHLGALQKLLEHIAALCALSGQELQASQWAASLERLFTAVFRAGPEREARRAQQRIITIIRNLALEPNEMGVDPMLHFAVVRDILLQCLARGNDSRPQALGRITFCSMVPQRAIPFRFVAVLGLNEGEFPRQENSGGLDLMARHRRLGDRDQRLNDRYLFLETLMSARAWLHLSFIGEDEHTGKPRNPAQPLAELLAVLKQHAEDARDGEIQERQGLPWLVRHAPQPFDARYFDGRDERLFSHSQRFAHMTGKGDEPAVAPFLSPAASIRHLGDALLTPGTPEPVGLRELHGYYKDPARHILEQRLRLHLAALDDDALPEDEPMKTSFEAIDTIARRLFFAEALPAAWAAKGQGLDPQAAWQTEEPPAWLRLGGRLPPGRAGRAAWAAERDKVKAMLEGICGWGELGQGRFELKSVPIDLHLGRERLMGRVDNVYDAPGGCRRVLLRVFDKGKIEELGFKERVPMFLDWAVLRLQQALLEDPADVRLYAVLKGSMVCPFDFQERDGRLVAGNLDSRQQMRAKLETSVLKLVAWWREATAHPLRYFPKTSWQALQGKEEEDKGKALDAWWSTKYHKGERDYTPGYARFLAESLELEDESTFAYFHGFAKELNECISLGAST